jgi:hypothetical protein
VGPSASDAIAGKAFDILAQQATAQRPAPTGPDYAVIERMLAPMKDQVRDLSRQLEAKDKALEAARAQPSDPLKDRFVEKLIDSDSARIAAIKLQHDSEIRSMRDNHAEDVKRIHAQYDRERDGLVRSHEREVANMKQSLERELSTTKMLYEAQITALRGSESVIKVVNDAEHKRLERENERLHKEVTELRLKKEKSVLEQVKEIKTIKEAFEGDDDEKDQNIFEKIIESPMAGKIVEKISGAFDKTPAAPPPGAPPPGQVDPRQFPPNVPFLLPDGRVAKNLPDGRTVVYQRPQPGAGGPPGGASGTEPPPGSAAADPAQIALAVNFMENACRSGTEPKAFASSIRNMVPQSVLQQLAALGVDDFLDKVAQLEATSPLNNQAGRLWARKVGKALVGGGDD